MKKQDTDCDKIFANHMSVKRVIFRIDKEFTKLNSKSTDTNYKVDNGHGDIFY